MNELMSQPVGSAILGEARPDFLREETLADLFVATARRIPQKVAIDLIGTAFSLTYAELDARSDHVARALAARGVQPGHFVGLWFKRSLDLHVAMLGILKAGAAYIPFDADSPTDRIAASLADCGADLILSHAAMADKTQPLSQATVLDLASMLAEEATGEPVAAGPDHPAYAIYTSGSTGKPKGITVTHRNICHYLRAGNDGLGVTQDDIVFQAASVAFDLSLEEIFVPYLVGATMKVATPEVLKETDRLPEILARENVSVVDMVPTLLSMFENDVPSLRLIILGGEACTPALIERFARPGRRILNTYGPTETTVVATMIECQPGEPITIGGPIANYTAYILREDMTPVEPGETGELVIGGPGVAQGYINLPEMTARKFVANPFGHAHTKDPVLYRTGDAVSLDPKGRLLFHGRIDDQVKIRGYRIELGEIEALIAAEPGVKSAAVAVHKDGSGGDVLVAHVVPNSAGFETQAVKKQLAAKVPPYMVPPIWREHGELPRLSSGKVDRKALATILLGDGETAGEQEEPRSKTEAILLDAAKGVFPGQAIPFEADFFTELGGHSLVAAKFVSAVRKTPALAGITMQDMYAHRSLRNLANALDAAGAAEARDLSFEPVPLRRRFLCGLAQAVALVFVLGLVTIQWLGLFLSSIFLIREDSIWWQEVLWLTTIYACLNVGSKLTAIALKWVVLGRTKPGVYPLWGTYYFRVWLAERLMQVTVMKFLQMSPLIRVYMRLLGAKVGKDAMIAEFESGAVDLISIGDRASIGTKVKFANIEVIGNQMHIGPISIGNDCYIGNASVIGYNAKLEDGVEVGDLTVIQPGQQVARDERWDGSPGKKVGMVDRTQWPAFPQASKGRRFVQNCLYAVSYLLILMIGLLPIFPAFYVLYNLDAWVAGTSVDYTVPWSILPLLAWPTALVLVIATMAIIVVLRWTILPRVREGRYSIHSWFFMRKWAVMLATEVTLETLSSLYATIFMRNWYRLMGAKIDKGSEISTNLSGRYDLVEIGKNNFIGDEAIFGDEEVRNGYMVLQQVKTGDQVFMGNHAVVPPGTILSDNSLIGVKSKPPEDGIVGPGETWFGTPAIKLPNREKIDAGAVWTYQPPRWRVALRGLFESLHTSLPTALFITCGYITADIISGPVENGQWLSAIGVFLAAGMVIAILLALASVIAKWVFMGIYKPTMKPMWSWWAMRTEAVAVLYGGLVGKSSIEFFRGTPFLPWILRLYGTKIGKGVWMDATDITEFDCITIGDHCVLNAHSCLQTHLYEDRLMKVGRIELGTGVTIGSFATVLYDSKIGDYAEIGPLSLIMKGENIPAHTRWTGAPAVPMRH